MKDSELHNAIRSRFKTQVATPKALTTIYDNDPTGPPADGRPWCRFTIRRGETRQITIGTKEFRMRGIAFAQLFCKVGRGDGILLELADEIAAVFRAQTVGGVRYGTPTIVPVGVHEGQDEYQVNVQCPFMADTQGS